MADVTGPISTLPGAEFNAPKGANCDEHDDRPAVARVQGETDSFGSEMNDMCQECYDKYLAEKKALGGGAFVGTCDSCRSGTQQPLFSYRDYEEGMSGPVYYQCASVGTLLAKLNDFLQQKDKLLVNRWIETNGVTVYVRVTVHIADGQTKRTLDIANVVVDGQNQGKFTAFLKGAEEAASKEPTIDGMYIENVQTTQLCDFFRRQGYHEIPSLDGNHCYYKPLKEN